MRKAREEGRGITKGDKAEGARLEAVRDTVVELYGCLVIGQFAAQVLGRRSACAVMDGVKPWESVWAMNRAARRVGICRGMTRVEVETFGGVEMVRRNVAEESRVAELVMECLGRFSPRVQVWGGEPTDRKGAMDWARASVADWEGVVDLSGTEMLLGTPRLVGNGMLEALEGLGLRAWLVVAGNVDAALSLARAAACADRGDGETDTSQKRDEGCAGGGRWGKKVVMRCQVVEAGCEVAALRGLGLWVLGLDVVQAERFEAWGIRTLGELASLGDEELIARMGQPGKALRARARGEYRELMQPVEEGLRLEEAMDFEDALETVEQVLFCLNPMLERLIALAGERSYAVALVEIALTLAVWEDRVNGQLEDPQVQVLKRVVQPAIATVDRALLLKMIQLDLEAHPLPGAINRVELRAETGDRSRIQLGLFAPQMPEPTRFENTYARLVALVGECNVGRLRALDTHGREAFGLERFKLPTGVGKPAVAKATGALPTMALRRMRPPAQTRVWMTCGQIESFVFEGMRHKVVRSYGPWRMSGDWWGPEVWSYDAWDLASVKAGEDETGEVMLCVMGFDLLRKQWQIEGLYD